MADGWITASFNALNQPMAMWSPAYSGTANFMWFAFDPLGRCVKRWVGPDNNAPINVNPATYYYYDGWNVVEEGTSASVADRTYVHGGRVDEIVASHVGGLWYYHHYDARGHCFMLTTATGGLQEQYDYDAFGFPYFYTATGSRLGSLAAHTRFLFTGREWLNDLRIYDYRARQYQPELGRFLQPDPKEFGAGDYNLYRYCYNDPVNRNDPTGLMPGPYLVPMDGFSQALGNLADTYEQYVSLPFARTFGFPLEHAIPQLSEMAALRSLSEATQTTAHGTERIAGALATRGGVLSRAEIGVVQKSGITLTQADGATVKVLQNVQGNFNVAISGNRGLITTFKNLDQKAIDKLAKKYEWTKK